MRTIVVTGATRGLGLAIAEHALSAGFRVIAIGRRPTARITQLIGSHSEKLFFEAYDLADTQGIHAFVTRVIKQYGRPWGLVNNAGIGQDGILATLHETDISKVLKINLEAPILLSKYFVRAMLLNREGRILNVTSIIASTGFKGLSVYGATKGGLASFTRSLAREVGSVGITVNSIAPGYMETDMTAGLHGEKLESIKRRSAIGRLVSSNDVAHAALYLLSEQAANITGTTLTIDAGSTA